MLTCLLSTPLFDGELWLAESAPAAKLVVGAISMFELCSATTTTESLLLLLLLLPVVVSTFSTSVSAAAAAARSPSTILSGATGSWRCSGPGAMLIEIDSAVSAVLMAPSSSSLFFLLSFSSLLSLYLSRAIQPRKDRDCRRPVPHRRRCTDHFQSSATIYWLDEESKSVAPTFMRDVILFSVTDLITI